MGRKAKQRGTTDDGAGSVGARTGPVVHGPARPAPTLTGVEHLRRALRLGPGTDLDRLCEEAATRLDELLPRVADF